MKIFNWFGRCLSLRDESPSAKSKNRKPCPTARIQPQRLSRVPAGVRPIPNARRGVFANEDIKKRTLGSKPTNSLEFYTPDSSRDFLAYFVAMGSTTILRNTLLWISMTETPCTYAFYIDIDNTSKIDSGDHY